MFTSNYRAAVVAMASVLGISTWAGAGVIGNTFNPAVIYDVNTSTGALSNARPTGLTSSLTGITFSSSGTLYGLTAFDGAQPNSLVTINTTTGAASVVGSTGLTLIFEGDLAFSPGGTLYGLQNVPSGPRELFTINTSTGAASVVGGINNSTSDLSAMIFSPAGNLYVLDTGNDTVLNVNPATAAVNSTTPLSVALGQVAGLTYDSSTGTYYVADGDFGTDRLYSFNPTTGLLTLIGNTQVGGLAGLAVTPTATAAVPVPASIYAGLVLLAGVGATRLLKRKQRA